MLSNDFQTFSSFQIVRLGTDRNFYKGSNCLKHSVVCIILECFPDIKSQYKHTYKTREIRCHSPLIQEYVYLDIKSEPLNKAKRHQQRQQRQRHQLRSGRKQHQHPSKMKNRWSC